MRIFSPFIGFLLAVTMLSAASAQEIKKGDLVISAPWSRATPAGSEVGAGYLVITNNGTGAERLVSFTTELAGQPEVHEMSNEGGVMKMRPLSKGLVIPAGGTVKLEPGGYHLMLLKLKKPLAAGQRYKATLVFEKAGPVEVEFEVRAMGAGQQKNHGGHHKH
ncbi:MAG TPA: copper chaperone PCu(A)C [Xanthobacteraceae bacterium]|nr:copper chaperone PCu(A)C [Xanthobacteraceae bacterium]